MMSFSGGGVEGTTLKWSFCVSITTIPEPARGGKIGLVPILYVEGKLAYRFSTVKTGNRGSQNFAVTCPIRIRAQW